MPLCLPHRSAHAHTSAISRGRIECARVAAPYACGCFGLLLPWGRTSRVRWKMQGDGARVHFRPSASPRTRLLKSKVERVAVISILPVEFLRVLSGLRVWRGVWLLALVGCKGVLDPTHSLCMRLKFALNYIILINHSYTSSQACSCFEFFCFSS